MWIVQSVCKRCLVVLFVVQLWMGTHPKGPSLIASSGESLAEWIENHHDALGDRLKSSCQLPFLFKVLSVNIALSIQVHPDKVCECIVVIVGMFMFTCLDAFLQYIEIINNI